MRLSKHLVEKKKAFFRPIDENQIVLKQIAFHGYIALK